MSLKGGFGISLINKTPQELVYITLGNIQVDYISHPNSVTMDISVGSVQVCYKTIILCLKDVRYCVFKKWGCLTVSESGSIGIPLKNFHHWHQIFLFEYGILYTGKFSPPFYFCPFHPLTWGWIKNWANWVIYKGLCKKIGEWGNSRLDESVSDL